MRAEITMQETAEAVRVVAKCLRAPLVALRVHDYRSNGVAQPLSRGQVVALHRFCL